MTKTFCIKPWTHLYVQPNGSMKLCCRSMERNNYNLKTNTIAEWWSSDFVQEIREKMLAGEEPAACVDCYSSEKQGATSYRQKSNKEYLVTEHNITKVIKHNQHTAPIDVELGLTNLCNLKCLMCHEQNSSSIATENKLIKISKINQSDYDVGEGELDKIKDLILTKPKIINFRGGESLMVPNIKEILKWGLDENLFDDTVIHITTNGTKLTDEWVALLTRFKKLRIMLSVDGVGKINDYIRFGSKWADVDEAASKLSRIPNVNFVVHATLSSLNVMHFDQLILWCQRNNYFLDFAILTIPKTFDIGTLPPELLAEARRRLAMVDSSIAREILKTLVTVQHIGIEEFHNEIKLRDNIRKVSILDIIPELGPYWNAKN